MDKSSRRGFIKFIGAGTVASVVMGARAGDQMEPTRLRDGFHATGEPDPSIDVSHVMTLVQMGWISNERSMDLIGHRVGMATRADIIESVCTAI